MGWNRAGRPAIWTRCHCTVDKRIVVWKEFEIMPHQTALQYLFCGILIGLLSGCDQLFSSSQPEKVVAKPPAQKTDSDKHDLQPFPTDSGTSQGVQQASHTTRLTDEQKRERHKQKHSDPPKPLMKDWPTPAVAMMITGETHGYIEPCGCTENQSGGVSRRADLLRQMRQRGWSTFGLDLGGTVKRDRRQSKLKFETILATLKDMNYKALGIGVEELRLDPDYLISVIPDSQFPESPLPFVSANVTFPEYPELGPAPFRILTVEPSPKTGNKSLRIAVTGILGEAKAAKTALKGAAINSRFAVSNPKAALTKTLQQITQQKPDLIVLLSHTSLEESRALAKAFPMIRLIVSAGGPEDPDNQFETIGNSMLITVGQKGKHTGVIGFYPDKPEQPLKYELVTIDQQRFKDTMVMVEHMRSLQKRLFVEKLAARELPIAHPSGFQFVGSEACGDCHTKAYEHWKTTPHAQAYESLKHAREGQPDYGITRIYDAECLSCHVTGWEPQKVLRYKTGFINKEFAADARQKAMFDNLQGSGCENCHGPGSEHIALIDKYYDSGEETDKRTALKSVKVSLEEAKRNTCYQCHDLDNSPHFEFDSYWKQVAHPWRD